MTKKSYAIGIAGLGLIGGSLAKGFAEAGHTLYGFDTGKEALAHAGASGIFEGVTDEKELFFSFPMDCIIVAVPVRPALAFLEDIRTFAPNIPVSDAVSTKASIVQRAAELGLNFCGGHPIAGKETSGFQNADAAIFKNAWHVLTPAGDSPFADMLEELHKSIGMRVVRMDAARHDALFGLISHLPHITAYALMQVVLTTDPDALTYTGGGFRDFTRIAASDPKMWADIFTDNSDAMITLIDRYIALLVDWRERIAAGDHSGLMELIGVLSSARRNL